MVLQASRGGRAVLTELSTVECLRILLDQQAHQLSGLRATTWELVARLSPNLTISEWHGPARDAYELTVLRLAQQVTRLAWALEEAISATSQAVATLSSSALSSSVRSGSG